MRPIKFRAWDKRATSKQLEHPRTRMVYCSLEAICRGNITLFDYQNWIIMLSTGLLDKNGKEIYEGDFVEDDMKQKEAVVMEYGEWRVYGRSLWQESKSKRIEVIGNIYENPELLKS